MNLRTADRLRFTIRLAHIILTAVTLYVAILASWNAAAVANDFERHKQERKRETEAIFNALVALQCAELARLGLLDKVPNQCREQLRKLPPGNMSPVPPLREN